jgi:5'-AMP-activated protein kinase catalytic alpha subunit
VICIKGYDGQKADVWSIGVILYVLLAGYLPFEESTTAALFKKIRAAEFEYPSWFSPEVRELLDSVLVVDPAQRISLQQFKNHPWITNGEDPRDYELGGKEDPVDSVTKGMATANLKDNCKS